MEATTRSTTTRWRASRGAAQHRGPGAPRPPSPTGPRRPRRPRTAGAARALVPGPGPHGQVAGVGGGHRLPDHEPDRRPRRALPRPHEHQDGHRPHPGLDQKVRGQRTVGPPGLQEAPVEREQDEEGRRGQDGGDADPAALPEQDGDPVPAGEDENRPADDDQRALAVHPAGPAADEVARPVLVPHGHPPDHGHHHGRAGHGEDQEQAGELVEHPVGVRVEQPGQGNGDDHVGPVRHQPRRGQGTGLEEPRPHGLDPGLALRIERELAPERQATGAGRQGDGGRGGPRPEPRPGGRGGPRRRPVPRCRG